MLCPVLHLKKGQMIGGKYKIVEKIGEGGMGIVYKAEDTKLKRNVALKFLPSELMRDKKAKARFIQEAQAAAALNHHNICIIHEVDEADDQTFIAMEYIEGQTLKEKIETGPLGVDEAVDILSQVAEGLGEAHKKGIVHRDIKPANIMLTEKGQAKIMDFGLAKLSWGADLTKPSMIMGTVAYMSPEQARGEPVDHRTDIWSLGAMLYEMLIGEKPFQKSHEQALIHSILNDEPKKISGFRSNAPGYLEKVISKALEKNAGRRFQTAEEMLQELKQSPSVMFLEPKKSIVVLPFENLSPDPDQEYFCDGMTEEIITDLSHIHDLLVISRSSAMTFKGTKKKIKEIAKDVNVQYVLEGSVRKAGNNLRITAQLIDAKSDAHIWAEKYGGSLDDVFDIQEKVSRSIVEALKMKITPDEERQIAARPIENVQAYEYYLKAMGEMQRMTEESAEKALKDLQMGLKIAGDNVLLFAGMGLAYCNFYEMGISATEDTLTKAEEYAFKVLRVEPNSALGYSLLGRIERFRGSALKALKHFNRALDIDPNELQALFWSGLEYFWHAGRPEVAKAIQRKLINLDPLSPLNLLIIGIQYGWTGEYDKALKSFEHVLELEPGSTLANFWTAYVLLLSGKYNKAYDLIDSMALKESTEQMHKLFTGWLLFLKHGIQGEKRKALKSLNEDVRSFFWNDADLPICGAGAFALIDEKDEALRWLEHSVNKGFINYPFISRIDPFLENIRGEPWFKKLMERVKYEWENFKV
jgi:non-specific serine/threonine protein kinase